MCNFRPEEGKEPRKEEEEKKKRERQKGMYNGWTPRLMGEV